MGLLPKQYLPLWGTLRYRVLSGHPGRVEGFPGLDIVFYGRLQRRTHLGWFCGSSHRCLWTGDKSVSLNIRQGTGMLAGVDFGKGCPAIGVCHGLRIDPPQSFMAPAV